MIKGWNPYSAEDLFQAIPTQEEAEQAFKEFLNEYEKTHCDLTD